MKSSTKLVVSTAIVGMLGMVSAGAAFADDAHKAGDAKTVKNECKGKGCCKTAKNECKGKNACKGQGGECPAPAHK